MRRLLMNLFGRPHGLLGRIGGRILAVTNKQINQWTVSLLDIELEDRILKIGFGPGIAAKMISDMIGNGKYIGIDPSEVTLSQAQKRNATAIREGKVELILADVERLPVFDMRIDKIFSINSIIFWKNPITQLKELRSRMTPGEIIAITLQRRSKGANDETTYEESKKILLCPEEAGFSQIRFEKMKTRPALTVCVLGENRPV